MPLHELAQRCDGGEAELFGDLFACIGGSLASALKLGDAPLGDLDSRPVLAPPLLLRGTVEPSLDAGEVATVICIERHVGKVEQFEHYLPHCRLELLGAAEPLNLVE